MFVRSSLALAAIVLVAACGGSPGPTPAGAVTGPGKVASIAGEIPAAMLMQAPFQIATDANGNAPQEYVDPATGQIVGWEVDFGNAVCRIMGVTCTWNNVTFDDIIAQLKASTPSEVANGDSPRYVFSISGWNPRPSREKAGIDFISYIHGGRSFVEKADGPAISSIADICGHSLSLQSGTVLELDAWGFMGKDVGGRPIPGDKDNCQLAGKPDITILSFASQTDVNTAVESGRADFLWNVEGEANLQVRQSNGKLKLAGSPCSERHQGIAIVHGSPLQQPLVDAVKYLIDSGYYMTILKRWGNDFGAIPSSEVTVNNNDTTSPCVPSY